MIDTLDGSKQSGTFIISPGKALYGELTFAGSKTSLYLRDNEHFDPRASPNRCVTGILHDLTKVSLIECNAPPIPGSDWRQGAGSYKFAEIFPHYVVHGDHHITPSEKKIAEVSFVMDDATALFYDFDAFGSLIDARPFIEQIAHANRLDREIRTGPDPQILYFTGKREIFTADTAIGTISATHNPSHNLGGPHGVSLKNTIVVNVAFKKTVDFEEAIVGAYTLLSYFGMLVGRPQNLLHLSIRIESHEEMPVILHVYCSMPPKREAMDEGRTPHPADALLDAVREPEQFSSVLGCWIERQQFFHDARSRFFSSFAEQQRYGIDRLVGSANMFDILPSSAVPPRCATLEGVAGRQEGMLRNIWRPTAQPRAR